MASDGQVKTDLEKKVVLNKSETRIMEYFPNPEYREQELLLSGVDYVDDTGFPKVGKYQAARLFDGPVYHQAKSIKQLHYELLVEDAQRT